MEGLTAAGARPNEPDPADIEALGECVELLQTAAARARLYGDTHPQTTSSLAMFTSRLTTLLEQLGPVTLDTAFDGLRWRGEVVSEERDDRVGIGRHLHVEGISEITFAPELTLAEVSELIAALRVNLSLPEFEEETLESLLWQAELQNVGFRAIASLSEAEALSGRGDDAETQMAMARHLIDLKPTDVVDGRRLRAAEDTDGGDVADHWDLDAGIDRERFDDEEWSQRFIAEAGEDLPEITRVRDGVRFERSSELLGRLVEIIVRARVSGQPDVDTERAERLTVTAMRQLYQTGDPIGVLNVLRAAHALAESTRESDPAATDWVRELLRKTYFPMRVARMLRHLKPTDSRDAEVLERFLRVLPDSAVVAFFEGVSKEANPTSYRPLMVAAIRHIGERIQGWLQAADSLRAEQLVPLVFGLRLSGSQGARGWRPTLLRHPSPAVREAVLAWYADELPEADIQMVAAMLLDAAGNVREAATKTLVVHRPAPAVEMLKRTMVGDAFIDLDPDRKNDVCVTFGRIAGPTGLPVLVELLDSRTGLLRNDAAVATIEAAALGLAAMATPNATRALEKGARSLSPARRAACQIALGAVNSKRDDDREGHDG